MALPEVAYAFVYGTICCTFISLVVQVNWKICKSVTLSTVGEMTIWIKIEYVDYFLLFLRVQR